MKKPVPTREEFEDLVTKLKAVWNDASTDVRLRKRIVRTLIHEVVVNVDSAAGELIVVLPWIGGFHTGLRVPWRRRGQNSGQTPKALVEAVTASGA